ncbi:MAG TPA: glycoside hydrolase family 15 protein, partial [Acidimicrobiales bacterium]|nr:glycoside hydrolase family 15 protein [Acidimicrobiales bacterium]
EGDFTASRRYREGTNVLETTFTTSTGRVRVTDALNVGAAGRLPWNEIARRVDGLTGSVHLRWEVAPGTRFGQARPFTWDRGTHPVVQVGDQQLGVTSFDLGDVEVGPHGVRGEVTVTAGDSGLLVLVATDNEPVPLPRRPSVESRLENTARSWEQWAAGVSYDGPWREQVLRSALALKLLLYAPSGAIAAAPTTSLPECVGGPKNWDYRYSWVRDSSFTLDAMIALDLREEVHAAVSWLLGTVATTAPDLHVFYKLDGRVANEERELSAPGYRNSTPVRDGNSAAGQSQLGTFGDLFDTVWRYAGEGHLLDASTGNLLALLADECCDRWTQPDSGIWELNDIEHYTISKIGCWVALDRACHLADAGHLPGAHAARWAVERDELRAWVNDNCWSEKKSAYTIYAGTDDLDAAVLLAGRTGFERGQRLSSTIDAVRAELGRGPFVYRYSGMQHEEGAFVACSFWLADALVRCGRMKEAKDQMDGAVAGANEVGLLAEQIDPASGEFLGNFHQGLSHLALINAAYAYQQSTSS